jgi:hypothetical protein
MRQKKEMNLVEDWVEVGIGKLGLDDGPEPEHWCGISDIRRLCLARPACKEATKFASARSDHRPGVSALGERAGVVVVWEDCPFIRIPVSLVGEVLTCIGEESSGTTNCGESGKATFDDVEAVFVVVVLRVGIAHAIAGENAPELEEAFGWVPEAGLRFRARIHLVYKVGTLDLRPWI